MIGFEDAVKNSLTLPDNLGGLATSYLSEAALADDQLTSTLLKDADMLIKRAGDNWHNHVETTVALPHKPSGFSPQKITQFSLYKPV